MRAISPIRNHPELKRAMLCAEEKRCYVFLYQTAEDGPCTYDYDLEDVESAKKMCLAEFGIAENDWVPIEDPLPSCRHDWIEPVRVVGYAAGPPRWVEFERLEGGFWKPLRTEPTAPPNGGPTERLGGLGVSGGPPRATGFGYSLYVIATVLVLAGVVLNWSGHVRVGTSFIAIGATLGLSTAIQLRHLKRW